MKADLLVAALLAATASAFPAVAQTALPASPITVITEPSSAEIAKDDGVEVALEWDRFTSQGYTPIEWNGPPERRLDVFEKLVAPSYLARTGLVADRDAAFDFELLNVTGGDFNDIIVSSSLPGDCAETGCRVNVFSTQDGSAWAEVAEFTAMGVAWRPGGNGRKPSLAAVGDEISPSFTLKWNGLTFAE